MPFVSHPFARKLRLGARLTSEDEHLLIDLARPVRTVKAHQDIMLEGSEPRWLPLIVEGWAYRYRILENGKRQIISLFLPGDLCEPFGVLPRFLDHGFGTLTSVTFSAVSLNALALAASANSTVREALWWDLLFSSSLDREHVVRLGRRSATERVGHLFCELYVRLKMVGLVEGFCCDIPLTQSDLADMLGLSTVHTNRSIQELRRLGLIDLQARRLSIRNFDELRELSMFDVTYLQIDPKL